MELFAARTKSDLEIFSAKAEKMFATKFDLQAFALKAEQMFVTKKDLELFATKADLNTGLKELEYKLTIKLGTIVTVVVGAIVMQQSRCFSHSGIKTLQKSSTKQNNSSKLISGLL